jgi:hypothetical protein
MLVSAILYVGAGTLFAAGVLVLGAVALVILERRAGLVRP